MCAARSQPVEPERYTRFADEKRARYPDNESPVRAIFALWFKPHSGVLGRGGIDVGKDRGGRLSAEHCLQVPKKRSRKRIAKSRPRPMEATMANAV